MEEGIGANRHNLIENSNLKNGLDRYTKVGAVSQGIDRGRNGGNAYYIGSDIDRYGSRAIKVHAVYADNASVAYFADFAIIQGRIWTKFYL